PFFGGFWFPRTCPAVNRWPLSVKSQALPRTSPSTKTAHVAWSRRASGSSSGSPLIDRLLPRHLHLQDSLSFAGEDPKIRTGGKAQAEFQLHLLGAIHNGFQRLGHVLGHLADEDLSILVVGPQFLGNPCCLGLPLTWLFPDNPGFVVGRLDK